MRKQLLGGFALACMLGVTSSYAITLWQVKCFNAEGQGVEIKAFTDQGLSYRVQGIELPQAQTNVLTIKAFNEKNLSMPLTVVQTDTDVKNVKVYQKGSMLTQVGSPQMKGKILDVKGVDDKGGIYQVKAFPLSDGKYTLKCVKDGEQLALKAVSPNGQLYDVKGFQNKTTPEGASDLQIEIIGYAKGVPSGSVTTPSSN